jgi:hypothetical protein
VLVDLAGVAADPDDGGRRVGQNRLEEKAVRVPARRNELAAGRAGPAAFDAGDLGNRVPLAFSASGARFQMSL